MGNDRERGQETQGAGRNGAGGSRLRPRAATGFDFTAEMRRLCEDMVRRLPELGHIDLGRVALSFCQTRKAVRHGMYASLTPLRFAGGATEMVRRGRRWGIQRLQDSAGREMLYILNFYLPRYLDLEFREKLSTVIHELWHISPQFDGDLRRFRGRCYVHSGSQKQFDAYVGQLAERWLGLEPPETLYEFLRYSFRELAGRHGAVVGRKIPAPKLIPLDMPGGAAGAFR
jgi:predicted metallopeptidase